jgi:hypothetical protein
MSLKYHTGRPKSDTKPVRGRVIEMTSNANLPGLRKRQLEAEPATNILSADEIDIARCATIGYSR